MHPPIVIIINFNSPGSCFFIHHTKFFIFPLLPGFQQYSFFEGSRYLDLPTISKYMRGAKKINRHFYAKGCWERTYNKNKHYFPARTTSTGRPNMDISFTASTRYPAAAISCRPNMGRQST